MSAAAPKATMSERVVAALRDEILSGRYRPGAPLREEVIGAAHGLSRNAVREVLRVLSAEGLATYTAFRGFRVPLLTVRDVEDIYRARRFVECGAVSLGDVEPDMAGFADIHSRFAAAVGRGDADEAFGLDLKFHAGLVGLSGSERLVAWHRELMHGLRLSHLVGPSFGGQLLVDSIPQHAEILVALAGAERGRAAEALQAHLRHTECALIREMSAPV